MPYHSQAQSGYIHAQAVKGVPWALKFVRDSHGTHVPKRRYVRKKKHGPEAQ